MDLKKPSGWIGSVRFDKIARRIRLSELPRIARANRSAATAIVFVFVLATALMIVGTQSPADKQVTAAPHAAAVTDAAAEPPQPATTSTPPVTITGCLERDDETFRLKDTEGTDAPKSRSWKTGFLKKKAASIEVVDANNRLKLTNFVGQRVSLTGTLVDREMRARRLQRVAPSCSVKPVKTGAAL